MRPAALCLLIAFAPLPAGCIAKTAVDVVTLPVKAVGSGVDAVTTSDSERDQKRGKQLRKREAQLRRDYEEFDAMCRKGDQQACTTRHQIAADYDNLQRY